MLLNLIANPFPVTSTAPQPINEEISQQAVSSLQYYHTWSDWTSEPPVQLAIAVAVVAGGLFTFVRCLQNAFHYPTYRR